MFIVVLLTLFVVGDLAWGWFVVSRLREPGVWGTRGARLGLVVTALFLVLTLGCLATVLVSRAKGGGFSLPVPLLMTVFLWHMLILPLILVGGFLTSLVLAVGRAGKKVMRRASREARLEGASEGVVGGGISRRQVLAMATAIGPPAAVALTTGFAFPRLGEFRIRQLDLPIPGLPSDLEGLTIAHVTDTHLGDFTSVRTYRRILDAVNGMRADLIVHTGDIINVDSDDIPDAMEGLKTLDARLGVFACEGNHDLIQNPGRFWRAMRDLPNVRFLRNEAAMVNIRGTPIQLFGARWATHAPAVPSPDSKADSQSELGIELACDDLRGAVQQGAFPILLAHHPHAFDYAPWAKLTLAGHTHGGQLMLTPRSDGFPAIGPGPLMYRYYSGLYRQPNRSLFVSNGAGNWFPLRINAPAEIVKITLRNA